jgi:hypothetical protein
MHYLLKMKEALEAQGWIYNDSVDREVALRKDGKNYSLEDHVRAMIYAMLSSQTRWFQIQDHIAEIDKIFGHFNVAFLLSADPDKLCREIQNIKCGNRSIDAQMKAVAHNVKVLQKIANEHGSIDAYMEKTIRARNRTRDLVLALSNPHTPYKLKEMGEPLVWEYIRNVGFDGAKPDTHLRRFLGRARMGTSKHEEATISEVLIQVEQLAKEAGLSLAAVDTIIWTYCADSNQSYGEVCTADVKASVCAHCAVRTWCNKSGCKWKDPAEAIPDYIVEISALLGKPINRNEIVVIDRGVPHERPRHLTAGKMAVYTYMYGDEFLKIGIAGSKSEQRYTSQHYNPGSAPSTLAGYILADPDMKHLGLTVLTVGEWIQRNCRRIDFELPEYLPAFTCEFVEKILHYKYTPRYEGHKQKR